MTILHLITGLSGGGAEHMVLELAGQTVGTADKTIAVSVSNRKQIQHKFEEKGIECHFLNITSPKSILPGLKKLKEICAKEKELVFHCHMFHAFAFGLLFMLFFKNVPIVFTLHTNKVKQSYRRVLLFVSKIFRKKDIIFSSNSKKWYLKNSVAIPNGVDTSRFDDSVKKLNDPFVFLFLGRLTEPKNPLFLIELVKRLKNAGKENFVIHVVGDGGYREALEQAIAKEDFSDYIRLFGHQNDVPKYLKDANCLIITSLWEGMPVSIIEAGASRLPVISTPVGSIPDFLNAENAYLTHLDGFHEAAISVMTNYDAALQKAEVLYALVKKQYDINEVYNLHLELYRSAIKG